MIRRIVKLVFYIKAPIKAFVVFHPVKAGKLWFAYVLGSALFGAGKRAQVGGAQDSRWGQAEKAAGPVTPPGDAEAEPAGVNGGNGGAPSARDEAATDAVPAAASVPEGHQAP